jgi:two-component system sensor histidine kinase DesK
MRVSSTPTPVGDPLLVVPRRGRFAMMSSLVFLIAPAVDFAEHASGPRLVAGFLVFAAFVALYTCLMVGIGRWPGRPEAEDAEQFTGIAGLIVLTVALVAIGGTDWAGLWCFVAAATGLRIDRRHAYPGLVALGVAAGLTEGLNTPHADAMFSLFIVTLGVGMLTGGFRRLRKVNIELGHARDEIARLAVADERLRFARDLHDLLGHSLSVVALKSELASRLIAAHPEQAAAQVHDIEAVSRRALAEVREAVAGYRRPVLSDELAGARTTLAAAGIEVEAEGAPPAQLPPDAEAVLAWAVREGATNVLRHADASRVRISVNVRGRDAELELVDDGSGAGPLDDPGTGLAGLAERVARVRGRMDAAPSQDGGFRLAVTVPLEGVA